MCEICEMEAVTMTVDELIEKYEDALECAEDWLERNIYSEIIEDLRDLK